MFEKKNKEKMNIQTADAILQNVFKACDAEPNKIPLENLDKKAKENYRTDNILIIIVSVLLFVSIILPIFFKSAQVFMSVDENSSRSLSVTAHAMTAQTLTLSFDGPGIDIASTYIETDNGGLIKPVNYDRSTNTVTFPGISTEANIYIYDVNGNCLHLLLTPHK